MFLLLLSGWMWFLVIWKILWLSSMENFIRNIVHIISKLKDFWKKSFECFVFFAKIIDLIKKSNNHSWINETTPNGLFIAELHLTDKELNT